MSDTSVRLPQQLTAPPPGWTRKADVVVIGSGIAGLSTALRYVEHAPQGRVVLVTKDVLANGSTRWAQGGIAAVTDPADTPLAHMVDTIAAGAGLCEPDAVRTMVTEGAGALRWLVERGTHFDRTAGGTLALTREGGHRAARIAHAGGDATGAEIERCLIERVRAQPRIELIEHAFVPDLVTGPRAESETRAVCGVTVHVMGEGEEAGVGAVHAPAVVLATGGMGQVFAATTNPGVSTGDGLALALRAGADISDLEFVQFHPTVLWLGDSARGQQPLISEAVRGEGAVLRDATGTAFMSGVHELADLAPRDVVTRSIAQVMRETHTDHVYLDARHFGAAKWRERFPTILASCHQHGRDPVGELLPVVPAAHYASGGVRVDLAGETTVPGLYAVGEVARTGVHGANRLASNSLLEGVVFAARIAQRIAQQPSPSLQPHPQPHPQPAQHEVGLVDPAAISELRTAMSQYAGVRRDENGLAELEHRLTQLAQKSDGVLASVAAWEATNLLTVAAALTTAARARTTSLGAHWRVDHADREPGTRADLALRRGRITLGWSAEARPQPQHGPFWSDLEAIAAGVGLSTEDAPAGPIPTLVGTAMDEDLAAGQTPGVDITSAATISETQLDTADVVARSDGTVAGLPLAEYVFWMATGGTAGLERHTADGDEVKRGDVLLTVTGPTRHLLTAERTALNLLTHLSGIATATSHWVRAVAGTGAQVRDTRKTHPGLRCLEKYAVRCGGGTNHRFGLADAALIKDNHVAASGGIAAAVRAVRTAFPEVALEVEVDRMDQIEPALAAGATELLLDNFSVAQLTQAVELVGGRARLEASGGLGAGDAAAVAATGVDYVAVGEMTHSSPALDIALDLRGQN